MRHVGSILASALLWILCPSPAAAQTLRVFPASQTAQAGASLSADVDISGLGDQASPSLGAFDLSICFDPDILEFLSLDFGPFLGDEALGEAVTSVVPFSDSLVALQVSLLLPVELIAQQPSAFTVLTVSFFAKGPGVSPLDLVLNAPLGDEDGNPLSAALESGQATVQVMPLQVPTLSELGVWLMALALMASAWRLIGFAPRRQGRKA